MRECISAHAERTDTYQRWRSNDDYRCGYNRHRWSAEVRVHELHVRHEGGRAVKRPIIKIPGAVDLVPIAKATKTHVVMPAATQPDLALARAEGPDLPAHAARSTEAVTALAQSVDEVLAGRAMRAAWSRRVEARAWMSSRAARAWMSSRARWMAPLPRMSGAPRRLRRRGKYHRKRRCKRNRSRQLKNSEHYFSISLCWNERRPNDLLLSVAIQTKQWRWRPQFRQRNAPIAAFSRPFLPKLPRHLTRQITISTHSPHPAFELTCMKSIGRSRVCAKMFDRNRIDGQDWLSIPRSRCKPPRELD
jgi:hypothetical protein